jgi:hypothetical protein
MNIYFCGEEFMCIVGCVQGKVIKTKSVEYMPFFLKLVSFLNGVCWTSYALQKFDLRVTVSNISIFRFSYIT